DLRAVLHVEGAEPRGPRPRARRAARAPDRRLRARGQLDARRRSLRAPAAVDRARLRAARGAEGRHERRDGGSPAQSGARAPRRIASSRTRSKAWFAEPNAVKSSAARPARRKARLSRWNHSDLTRFGVNPGSQRPSEVRTAFTLFRFSEPRREFGSHYLNARI